MAAATWVPIEASKLRIGHYVRIGHRWLDHPFIQRSFQITSPSEIAIIRDARLTQLFIDPVRSMPVPDVGSSAAPETDAQPPEAVAADAARLHVEKAAHTETVRRQREELATAQRRYGSTVDRAATALSRVGEGDPAATAQVTALVQALLSDLGGGDTSPLAFAAAATPQDATRKLACLALDAATIAALVGRRIGLAGEPLQALVTGALLHLIGLGQLPEELRDERRVADDRIIDLQDYPLLGVEQLRSCGGFAPEVLKIVRQHREHLDGSGFPEGAAGPDIHPHAPIVGAVREFQLLSLDTALTPAAALAQLYRERRGPYGSWAVDNLIATLTIYPPGTFLTLSDGSIARVMRVSTAARLRPLVCLFDEQVEPQEAEILDLATAGNVSVASVLNPATLSRTVLDFFGRSLGGFAVAGSAEAAAASIAA